jgi:hypothetical protein
MVVLFGLPVMAKTINPADFPVEFQVQKASTSGSECTMLLVNGQWGYWVSSQAINGFSNMKGCSVFHNGSLLRGRFRKSGFSFNKLVDILGKDADGRAKVFTYGITDTVSTE